MNSNARALTTLAVLSLILWAYVAGKAPATQWYIRRTFKPKIFVVLSKVPDNPRKVVIQEFIHDDGPYYYVFTSEKKARAAAASGLKYPVYSYDRDFFLASMPEELKVWVNIGSRPALKTTVATLREAFPHVRRVEAQMRYIPPEDLR